MSRRPQWRNQPIGHDRLISHKLLGRTVLVILGVFLEKPIYFDGLKNIFFKASNHIQPQEGVRHTGHPAQQWKQQQAAPLGCCWHLCHPCLASWKSGRYSSFIWDFLGQQAKGPLRGTRKQKNMLCIISYHVKYIVDPTAFLQLDHPLKWEVPLPLISWNHNVSTLLWSGFSMVSPSAPLENWLPEHITWSYLQPSKSKADGWHLQL